MLSFARTISHWSIMLLSEKKTLVFSYVHKEQGRALDGTFGSLSQFCQVSLLDCSTFLLYIFSLFTYVFLT